jgi:hypothetical protein
MGGSNGRSDQGPLTRRVGPVDGPCLLALCHSVEVERRYQTSTLPLHLSCDAVGVGSPYGKSPSDPARDTACARVLTSSFKKICLACDFTVSGEISRARAMRLLERPWLIIVRISRSLAVNVSLTRQLDCAERPYPERASRPESRPCGKGRPMIFRIGNLLRSRRSCLLPLLKRMREPGIGEDAKGSSVR